VDEPGSRAEEVLFWLLVVLAFAVAVFFLGGCL